MGRVAARKVPDPHLREGLAAYTHDQADIRRAMRDAFRLRCLPLVVKEGVTIGAEWGVVPPDSNGTLAVDLEQEDEEYEDMARMHAIDEEQMITVM